MSGAGHTLKASRVHHSSGTNPSFQLEGDAPSAPLHALAIQDFPLDLRSLQRLLAHQLHRQKIPAVLFQMFQRTPIDP